MKFVYSYQNRRLILVGTAHVSPQSVKEVEDIIDENVSDVCIELDRQRYNSIKEKKNIDISSKKKKNRKRKKTSINREYGFAGNLFLIIGSFIQKRMGAIFNLEPGAEFSVAIKIAKERDINLYLIDQKINKTLSEFKLIPKKEQWKFLKSIIWPFGIDKSNLKNIDKNKVNLKNLDFDYDTILNITQFMNKNFPMFYEVLVEKRNRVMSRNVEKIFKEKSDKDVIMVVGAGHLPGILNILDKDEDLTRII